MGAILLAAVYHTCLYFFRRNNYLQYYIAFLWVCTFSLMFESVYIHIIKSESNFKFLISNFLRIVCFQLYIVFVIEGVFSSVRKQFPLLWKLYISTFIFNALYIITIFVGVLIIPPNTTLKVICSYFSNFLLIATAVLMLRTLLKNYPDKFAYSIVIGSVLMLAFNVLALIQRHYNGEQAAVAMAGIGFFIEIIFFSVAIGLRLKQDEILLLRSNEKIVKQEQMLKQSEFERQIEIYIAKSNERKRISRDIHDGITNDLLGLKFHIQSLKKKSKSEVAGNCYLDPLEQELTTIYNDSRKFMHLLFSEEEGSDYLLDVYVKALTTKLSEDGLNITVDIQEAINSQLTIFQKNNIYLIVKEAFSNILKHSGASGAKVVLKVVNGACILRVADNGGGLEKEIKFGIGLKSMEERAKAIEGQLRIKSDNMGTCLFLDFPLCKD